MLQTMGLKSRIQLKIEQQRVLLLCDFSAPLTQFNMQNTGFLLIDVFLYLYNAVIFFLAQVIHLISLPDMFIYYNICDL